MLSTSMQKKKMRKLRLTYLAYLVAFGISCALLLSEAAAPDALLIKRKLAVQERYWKQAAGTWYGDPNGDGSDSGACGYGSQVKHIPFLSKVSAGSPDLFKAGEGCGACYQVRCTNNNLCSAKPVTVVITDECLGGQCSNGQTHFDLSGTAFGDMAFDPARAGELRNVGAVSILFRRVPCEYPRMKIAFQINQGSSPYWFAFLVEYEDGDGDLGAVSLKQANSNSWQAMEKNWGAIWDLRSSQPLQSPFSVSLTTLSTRKSLTAVNVIPRNWQSGATYRSVVNFE